jgi:alpha-L-fucosidase 2
MLLQSHANTARAANPNAHRPEPDANVVRFLPALPKALPNGTFRGLRARGGLEVDCDWENGKATSAVLRATTDHIHRIAAPEGQTITAAIFGTINQVDTDAAQELTLPMKSGDVYTLHFA